MRSAKRQMRVAGALAACALTPAVAGALTGCETTQETAAAKRAESKRILDARKDKQRAKSHDDGRGRR